MPFFVKFKNTTIVYYSERPAKQLYNAFIVYYFN